MNLGFAFKNEGGLGAIWGISEHAAYVSSASGVGGWWPILNGVEGLKVILQLSEEQLLRLDQQCQGA